MDYQVRLQQGAMLTGPPGQMFMRNCLENKKGRSGSTRTAF